MAVNDPAPEVVQTAEQLRYARLLDLGTRVGLVVLVVSFLAYAFGLLPAQVPVEQLPALWGQPVHRYLALSGMPSGWGWLGLVHKGDVAGLAGIVILAGCSVLCLLALVPLYLRRGDRRFAALCVAEVLVVLLAASGWLAAGH